MFKNNRTVINIFLKHHVYNDPAVNGNYVYNYHNVWFIFLLRFDMTVLRVICSSNISFVWNCKNEKFSTLCIDTLFIYLTLILEFKQKLKHILN